MHSSVPRRHFLGCTAAFGWVGASGLSACGSDRDRAARGFEAVGSLAPLPEPKLTRLPLHATFSFEGAIGERLRALQHNWLIALPRANPLLTAMYDRPEDNRDMLPWRGEAAGKYLLGALQVLRITRHPDLERATREVIGALLSAQGRDGYLGVFPASHRFGLWDAWNHYHCMHA